MNNTEGNNLEGSTKRAERLRLILERQQSRAVTPEEAIEVGESLIAFFQILGEETHADDDILNTQLVSGTANG